MNDNKEYQELIFRERKRICEELKNAREFNDIKKFQVSTRVSRITEKTYNHTRLTKIENGEVNITIDNLILLADLVGLQVSFVQKE